MIPQSRHLIEKKFKDIVAYIMNENKSYCISDTRLFFTPEDYNYADIEENAIYFSMLAYYHERKKHAIIESREYIDQLGVSYYVDRTGNYYIVTDTPETLTILHELAHIIVHAEYPGAEAHGQEFVDVYTELIRTFDIF